MNYLDIIINNKLKEIAIVSQYYPIKNLEQSELFTRECFSLTKKILNCRTGIIAEFKRKSPSNGIINNKIYLEKVARGYQTAGAIGLSVITDKKYFGGSMEDLYLSRLSTSLPILCKDFIIDEYQLIYAKSRGVDAVLLIAETLSKNKCKSLATQAKNLGLEVILEINSVNDLNHMKHDIIDIIGINNRNLNSFSVDINQSVKLLSILPTCFIKISESGIYNPENILNLRAIGCQGFLIGEMFMRSTEPVKACKSLIQKQDICLFK